MTKNLIVEINQDIGEKSDKIQSVLSEKNFCIIRGAIDPKIVKNGIKKLKNILKKMMIIPLLANHLQRLEIIS